MSSLYRHQCFIYEGAPSRNLPAVVAVIKQKLQEKKRCLYLDRPTMIAGFRSYLAAAGVDVAQETTKASLVLSSDRPHLIAGRFDLNRMMQALQDAVEQALHDGFDGLWAAGDMTWEFGPEGDFSQLVEYEWRLEEFIRGNPSLSGICLYHADTLPREAVRQGFSTHQSHFVNETLSKINPRYSQKGVVSGEFSKSAELDSAIDDLCSFGESN